MEVKLTIEKASYYLHYLQGPSFYLFELVCTTSIPKGMQFYVHHKSNNFMFDQIYKKELVLMISNKYH